MLTRGKRREEDLSSLPACGFRGCKTELVAVAKDLLQVLVGADHNGAGRSDLGDARNRTLNKENNSGRQSVQPLHTFGAHWHVPASQHTKASPNCTRSHCTPSRRNRHLPGVGRLQNNLPASPDEALDLVGICQPEPVLPCKSWRLPRLCCLRSSSMDGFRNEGKKHGNSSLTFPSPHLRITPAFFCSKPPKNPPNRQIGTCDCFGVTRGWRTQPLPICFARHNFYVVGNLLNI